MTLKERIENTVAYSKLDNLQKELLKKRSNRIQVEDAYTICKNIGLEKYESQTRINFAHHGILKELLANDES